MEYEFVNSLVLLDEDSFKFVLVHGQFQSVVPVGRSSLAPYVNRIASSVQAASSKLDACDIDLVGALSTLSRLFWKLRWPMVEEIVA